MPAAPPDGAPAPPRHRLRRAARWALFAGAALLVLVNAVLGAALLFGNRTLDKVERVTVQPGLLTPSEPKLPLNILVVGSDSRADLDAADQRSFGTDAEVKGQRSDTMMVVHADPRTGQVGVLSIPRDLYVPLTGFDRSDRINMAFFEGGHDALIATIQDAIGLKINHFVEVDSSASVTSSTPSAACRSSSRTRRATASRASTCPRPAA